MSEQTKAEKQFTKAVKFYQQGDYVKSVKWLWKAADQGDARAQYNLGVMYANGKGVTQSDSEAAKLFRLAADQGDVYAKYRLKELDAAK